MDLSVYQNAREYDDIPKIFWDKANVTQMFQVAEIMRENNIHDNKLIKIESLLNAVKEYKANSKTLFQLNFDPQLPSFNRSPELIKISKLRKYPDENKEFLQLIFEPDFQSDEKLSLFVGYRAQDFKKNKQDFISTTGFEVDFDNVELKPVTLRKVSP